MVFIVLEIIFVCAVLLLMTRNKEKMLKRLGKAFVGFIGVNIAFCLYYIAYICNIMATCPQWTPLDYISIAAFCCLIVMGFEITKND